MLPEALLNSEIASATWLFVGGLLPAAIIMLSGTSNGVAAAAGAAGAVGSAFTTFVRSEAVRSEAIFGGRSTEEAAAAVRSYVADVARPHDQVSRLWVSYALKIFVPRVELK